MTTITEHVDRWYKVASDELADTGSDLPPELLLAVWWRESRGTPGQRNLDGGPASGLGQITPVALDFYNLQHSTSLIMADMRGTDPRSIALQAKVSAWLLRWNLANAARWLEDAGPRDGYLVGLFAYHQGWPAVRARLEQLQRKGVPLSWANLELYFPEGWQGKADPFRYAEGTFDVFRKIQGAPDQGTPVDAPELPALAGELPPVAPNVTVIVVAGAVLTFLGLVLVVLALTRGSK